jgi:hypothetical protein
VSPPESCEEAEEVQVSGLDAGTSVQPSSPELSPSPIVEAATSSSPRSLEDTEGAQDNFGASVLTQPIE